MSRRVRVPGADELFRATGQAGDAEAEAAANACSDNDAGPPGRDRLHAVPDVEAARRGRREPGSQRRSTGRERHREKITVYVSAEELLDLEHARLSLRAEHRLAVDRGRLVREAVAAVLEDFEALGEASTLVRRLRRA